MFITADQILAHLVGDYVVQSHWMAQEKTKRSVAAAAHAISYAAPFLFLTTSAAALLVICASHFVVDRWRLARFLVWAKNGYYFTDGASVSATGYRDDVPAWLSVWLLIIADNVVHLVCNGLAIFLLS